MSENSRYVTKASLRHITANDEASSLSGDFIIAHHSPALFRKGEDGRKKKREVLHLFRCYTHTLGDIRFAWQAWHLWYWVAPLGPV